MVPISYLKKLFNAYCGLTILEKSINKLDCNETHKRDTQSEKLRTKVAVCTFTRACWFLTFLEQPPHSRFHQVKTQQLPCQISVSPKHMHGL